MRKLFVSAVFVWVLPNRGSRMNERPFIPAGLERIKRVLWVAQPSSSAADEQPGASAAVAQSPTWWPLPSAMYSRARHRPQ